MLKAFLLSITLLDAAAIRLEETGPIFPSTSTTSQLDNSHEHLRGTAHLSSTSDGLLHHKRTLTTRNTSDPFQVPFTVSPFQATAFHETSQKIFGTCDRNGFDAQYTSDPICQTVDECNLGFTQAGEFVAFTFEVDEDDLVFDTYDYQDALMVDVTVRVASNNKNHKIQLELRNDLENDDDDDKDWPAKSFSTPGKGYQEFEYITWSDVRLDMEATEHTLYVLFVDNNINLCSVSVKPATRVIPFRAPALDFNDFYEVDPTQEGVCGNGLVDAQPTSDLICIHRDGSECNIGFTEPGEWVSYYFTSLDSEDYYVWARIASEAPDKTIRLEVEERGGWTYSGFKDGNQPTSFTFEAPALGWQAFVDVGFPLYMGDGDYTLKVYFETGAVNLCSVQVVFMAQWAVDDEHQIPVTYNALKHHEAIDSHPNHLGNCQVEGPVDSQFTPDNVCRASGPCHVAFTQPGEILRYDFATHIDDFSNLDAPGPLVDIRLRVSSFSTNKRFMVEVDGNRRIFNGPGKGFDDFEGVLWENVPLKHTWYHPMYVVFLDGDINLCLVRIHPAGE
jgi:hypothetical protein